MCLRISFSLCKHIVTGHVHGSGSGNQQAAQHADGGGFSGTIGTQQTENFSFFNRKGYVVDRGEVPEFLCQMLYNNRIFQVCVIK